MLDKEVLVLKSRIRLARNLSLVPFPHILDDNISKEVVKNIEDAFFVSKVLKDDFKIKRLWENDKIDNLVALEKHLISPKLIKNKMKSAYILNKNEDISLMINEEDHIRLQAISNNLDLSSLYKKASVIDDVLSEKLTFAYDYKLGYITACPTNLGTGMRASVMVHLPGLTLSDKIGYVAQALAQMGMTIRGIYGEGSQAEGNIYQISNEVTLGMKEEDIIYNLKDTIKNLLDEEQSEQKQLLNKYKYEIEDKIYRSLGILMNSRMMPSKEALYHLSLLRLGIETEILRDIECSLIDNIIINTQPGMMQKSLGKDLNEKERDINRSKIIRNIF